MTARVAAIDLGTNTVRLLVADVAPRAAAGWRTVLAEQRVTRLGEGDFGAQARSAMPRPRGRRRRWRSTSRALVPRARHA